MSVRDKLPHCGLELCLVHGGPHRGSFVNKVINFHIPQKIRNFLTADVGLGTPGGFSSVGLFMNYICIYIYIYI